MSNNQIELIEKILKEEGIEFHCHNDAIYIGTHIGHNPARKYGQIISQEDDRVVFLTVQMANIHADEHLKALRTISKINCNMIRMVDGSFGMGMEDGDIRYRSVLYTENEDAPKRSVVNHLGLGLAMIEVMVDALVENGLSFDEESKLTLSKIKLNEIVFG